VDPYALRVEPRHDVFDCAVLACSIHGLENQKYTITIMRVVHILDPRELLAAFLQSLHCLLTCKLAFVTSFEFPELDFASGLNEKLPDVDFVRF
jgi:hypothetical protein